MTSNPVQPDRLRQRYETHHEKLMTLYVTRQDQEFVVGSDLQLVDVHLIRSSVELVGEPGWAGGSAQYGYGHSAGAYDTLGADKATQAPTYCSTVNELYAMNRSTSVMNGLTFPNAVQHKSFINHGWVDVRIGGMADSTNFMQDDERVNNRLQFVLPTDSGLLHTRSAQQNGPPQDLKLENVKMQAKIKVHTDFMGSWPQQRRVGRFVEDFADTDPSTYREDNGTVKYYEEAGLGPCQIPANLINALVLQFKVKPRSTL